MHISCVLRSLFFASDLNNDCFVNYAKPGTNAIYSKFSIVAGSPNNDLNRQTDRQKETKISPLFMCLRQECDLPIFLIRDSYTID